MFAELWGMAYITLICIILTVQIFIISECSKITLRTCELYVITWPPYSYFQCHMYVYKYNCSAHVDYNKLSLRWRHNGPDSVSNYQPHYCLLNRLFSDADQRKHQSSASLAFARGIHRGLVNSPHKWPVMRKMFPFDDVIMCMFKQPM